MRILVFLAAVSASSLAVATALATPAAAAQSLALPQFDSVGLNGSGNVTIRRGTAQQVVIREGNADTSEFRVKPGGSLEIKSCRARCPSDYRLVVEIVMPEVKDLAVSGSGRISVAPGFAPRPSRNFAVNGSGDIDARSLSAGSVHAAVSGSGRITTGNVASLQAAVSGSGRIGYAGSPKVHSAISGSGWVGRDH